MGAEETFEKDLVGARGAAAAPPGAGGPVARRLRDAGKKGRIVTLKVKHADFELVTRGCTPPFATDDGKVLFDTAHAQLERAVVARPIRLIGVSASGFDTVPAEQLGLFDHGADSPARAGAPAPRGAQRRGRRAERPLWQRRGPTRDPLRAGTAELRRESSEIALWNWLP